MTSDSQRYGYAEDRLCREPDPHRARRRELLARHPEIADLFGHDRRTAYVGVAVTLAQLALAWSWGRYATFLPLGARVLVLFAASFFVGAILSHWLAMVIHETSHYLALPTRAQNRALAILCNIPCLIPMAMSFHRYHPLHHANLGILGTDADMPAKWEIDLVGNSRLKTALWLTFSLPLYAIRNINGRMIQTKTKPNAWEIANLVVQILSVPLLAWATGGWGFAYLFLSFNFAMTIHPVAAHFVHEHFTFAPGQETFSYYGPLNAVTFNVGYHVEHHDFDRIPGWKLPEFHRRYSTPYQQLVSHNSWTWVLWHFVMSPMGMDSRIVRAPAKRPAPMPNQGRARRTPSLSSRRHPDDRLVALGVAAD